MSLFKNDHREARAFRDHQDPVRCPLCERRVLVTNDGHLVLHKQAVGFLSNWCSASRTDPVAWYTEGE